MSPVPKPLPSRDQDIAKGAMEEERPAEASRAPALDDNGLPSDKAAIAEGALGARADGTQG